MSHFRPAIISRLFAIQFVVAFVVAAFTLFMFGVMIAESVFLGALLYIIPNLFFARKAFKHQGASSARNIVNAFYKGEAVKIILSVLLFAVVFSFLSIDFLIFFGAYISMQLLMWLVPIFEKKW